MRNNHGQTRRKKVTGRRLFGIIALGLSALLLLTSGCTRSRDDRITASTEAPPTLNTREAKALSLAATKVLHEASRARRAFIPISDSLLALDALIPESRGKTDSDPVAASPSDRVSSTEEAPFIERSELGYVALFLDVSLAKERLETAETKLRADDTDGASEALLAVHTEGVTFELAEVELPLEEAAANLKLAEYDVSEQHIDAAAANLAAAAEALQAYELGQGRYADKARQMRKEIDALGESLSDATASAHGRGEVEETIASSWKEIAGWLGFLQAVQGHRDFSL